MNDDDRCQVCGGDASRCNCCESCMVHESAIDGCECGAAHDTSPSFTVWTHPDGSTTIEHDRGRAADVA